MAIVLMEEEAIQSLLNKAVERGIEIGGQLVSAHLKVLKQKTKVVDSLITQKEAAARLKMDVKTFKGKHKPFLIKTDDTRPRFYLSQINDIIEKSNSSS